MRGKSRVQHHHVAFVAPRRPHHIEHAFGAIAGNFLIRSIDHLKRGNAGRARRTLSP